MTMLHHNHVRPEDSEELQEALAQAGLPSAEFGPHAHYRRYSDDAGHTVGFGGLDGAGQDRLLRSIVVLAEWRDRGYGVLIVRDLEAAAAASGATKLHLLTLTAVPFFERLNYQPGDRMHAPIDIAMTSEFSVLCPKTARYMVKTLG